MFTELYLFIPLPVAMFQGDISINQLISSNFVGLLSSRTEHEIYAVFDISAYSTYRVVHNAFSDLKIFLVGVLPTLSKRSLSRCT